MRLGKGGVATSQHGKGGDVALILRECAAQRSELEDLGHAPYTPVDLGLSTTISSPTCLLCWRTVRLLKLPQSVKLIRKSESD